MGVEQLLKKLNDTMDKVVEKIDDQGKKISELSVKVDFYRESHHELSRKQEIIDKMATESLASTRSAHKRLDEVDREMATDSDLENLKNRVDKHDKIFFWVSTLVIGAVILAVLGTVIVKGGEASGKDQGQISNTTEIHQAW